MTTGSVGFDAGLGAGFATGFGFVGTGDGTAASAAGAGVLSGVSSLVESWVAGAAAAFRSVEGLGEGSEPVGFVGELAAGVVASAAGGFAGAAEG